MSFSALILILLVSLSFGYVAKQQRRSPFLTTSCRNRILCCEKDISEADDIRDIDTPPSRAPEMTAFDREMRRQTMGNRPDKLAETLYAVGTVQGSNVFKLVKDLDDLTLGLERVVQEMEKAAKCVEEERLKKKSEKREGKGAR